MPPAVYVAGTVVLTVYGQLIVKWRVDHKGSVPHGATDKLNYVAGLFADPWVLTALGAAAIAAACWMLALTRLELSFAYPFVSLSFALVLVASAVFFDEALTPAKAVGIAFILGGLVIGSR